MVLIFDLDDTLYEERTYVSSGFRAVAQWLETRFGWDPDVTCACMLEALDRYGRGRTFDRVLEEHGKLSAGLVRACVRVYREHAPDIRMLPAARDAISQLSSLPLYLVTDGHKAVQARKVQALGIASWFERVYLTHRYGLRYAKPSTFCFEKIRQRERCRWDEMVHVADNPAKDFISLNPLGMHTVRVLTGMHRTDAASPGNEAKYRIADLTQLPPLLQELRI